MTKNAKPLAVWLLIILLCFLSIGGFYGGISMLLDPSGSLLGLPADLLAGLPISSFVLPGLFLVGVMGVLPLLVAYGLWVQRPWGWGTAVAMSVSLIGWIGLQVLLWGAPLPIQLFFLLLGILLLALCLAPGTRAYASRARLA